MKEKVSIAGLSVKEHGKTTTVKEGKEGPETDVFYSYKLDDGNGTKITIKSPEELQLKQGLSGLGLKIAGAQSTLDDVTVSVNGKELPQGIPTPEEVGAQIKKEQEKQTKEAEEKLKAIKAEEKKKGK